MDIIEVTSLIKDKLGKIDNCLNSMDGDSYIPNNTKITHYVGEIKELYDKVKASEPPEVLAKIKQEVNLITKLIDKKFDNIIRNKNIELQELSKELKALQNQKKMANYR